MGMLTWPADQGCGGHCTLQLGGGGEGVGDASDSHTMGQMALGALHRRGAFEKHKAPSPQVFSFKEKSL